MTQVILDVQQFSPDEIVVKTVDNNVIVEAKHEEKKDEHGYISRHFIRRYILPSCHDPLEVTSSLSSDGVLTITAPKKVTDVKLLTIFSHLPLKLISPASRARLRAPNYPDLKL